ncbi:Lrp/AsnC family transcriptional regulator [Candidatus Woesearchaeota archaeon]|nr:Lrp/AsnC family transcriptional regulator [Candidatus Woesearchaeota archaeon]
MKEWINLKAIDKSLLAQLYYNSRENAAKIAKQLHISREQVAYRIKKFEELKIIKGK